jgi:hypothetical protein
LEIGRFSSVRRNSLRFRELSAAKVAARRAELDFSIQNSKSPGSARVVGGNVRRERSKVFHRVAKERLRTVARNDSATGR